MSEPVLKSIIQLLAVSASIDGVITNSEKRIIHDFIHENINEEYVHNFVNLFNDYASVALEGKLKTSHICQQINQELNQKQKIIVLFHLLELINSDKHIEREEANFVREVAETFYIDTHEYNIIKAFVTDDDVLKLGLNNILVIDNQENKNQNTKHIHRPNLDASIGILRIPSVEMYMLKFFTGKDNVFLNGISMRDRHIYAFSNGANIRSEKISTVYYSDVVSRFLKEQQGTKISFEANHVYFTFKNKKIGLRDINVVEESGRLVGIMGSSGSGKSTLLNVLNGNDIPIGGKVSINGIDVHEREEREKIKGVIGYVPQDDLLIEELTVFQNLYYATKLCFANLSETETRELVDKTLSNLGLLEISHLKVGSKLEKIISGGQRKRLNIALELLREPAILFIDEPTSGLSSNDSENIFDLLKELSLKGKLIFTVIHQPSSDIFKMFDSLIILDVGGYQIYYGNPVEAITYFRTLANLINTEEGACPTCGNVNPEQIFNIIETKVVDEYGRYTKERKTSPVQWRKHFEEHIKIPKIETNTETPTSTLKLPSKIKQWLIFSKRDIFSKLSNRQYMFISLLEAPILAIILAYIVRYYHIDHATGASEYIFSDNLNLPAYIFMSIIVSLFIGLTVSAEEIIKDAKILKRERFLHLNRHSYLFSKLTILFVFSAVQTLTYVIIGNWILEIQGMHFKYWLVLFSTACFANMLGLNISATFNSAITIYILIPVLLIPQLILGGIVVKFDEINPHLSSENKVPMVSEIMTSRWAFEALAVAQYKDNLFQSQFYKYDKRMAVADYARVYYIPSLESKLDFIQQNFTKTEEEIRQQVDNSILLLRNEITKQDKPHKFVNIAQINVESFDAKVSKNIRKYLEEMKQYYIQKYQIANQAKDNLVKTLTNTKKEKALYMSDLHKYHNKAIEDLATNKNDFRRIVEIDGKLIQKIYPVFQDPDVEAGDYFSFRTHFFAPRKHFLGLYYDTLYFNVVIIWSMTLLLYFTLYFKLLKKLLRFLGGMNKKGIKRRR